MLHLFADPIVNRGIELLIIVCGGILFGYLGYRLFLFGATSGSANLSTESKFVKLVFSGSAPGLFFMFGGGCILVAAILRGGAETRTSDVSRPLIDAAESSVSAEATALPPIAITTSSGATLDAKRLDAFIKKEVDRIVQNRMMHEISIQQQLMGVRR